MINRQNTASFFRCKDEDSGVITISKQEYDQLIKDQELLRALNIKIESFTVEIASLNDAHMLIKESLSDQGG